MDLFDKGVVWNQADNTLAHTSGQVLAEMERHLNVPVIVATPLATSSITLASVPYRKMHRRLMHAGKAVVEEVCKRAGISLTHKNDSLCEGCLLGKATDELGKEAPIQGTAPFDFVRVDLVTHKNPGHLGYCYSIHVVDVWSNYHWIKFARTKSSVLEALVDWVEMIYTQTERRVKIIGIDGGTEFGQASKPFADSRFDAWIRSKGIVVFRTTPHTPWMNGKIERAAKDIVEKTRATIITYNIPERLWPFVMETVVQVVNLLPTKANPLSQSPHERFATALQMPVEARQPHVGHLRAYFCEAYYYIKPQKRDNSDKFAPKAEKGRLIGYADLHGKIYWVWNPVTDKIARASAVRFNEGPDIRPDDDVETEYEAVFVDTTSEEEKAAFQAQETITLTHPTGKEQQVGYQPQQQEAEEQQEEEAEQEEFDDAVDWFDTTEAPSAGTPKAPRNPQLPTPQDTPSPDITTLDNDDLAEIQGEGPVPPDHPLAPYTGHSPVTPHVAPQAQQPVGGSEQQLPTEASDNTAGPSRPRRGKAKYGTGSEPGYYSKLAKGALPGQSFYAAHLVEPPPPSPVINVALSHLKVDHDIETSGRSDVPQNYRQASRLQNFHDYWFPAMQQQQEKLLRKGVYELVPKRPGMTILPSKWVYDEKTDPNSGQTTARARWVVCGNFDRESWDSQDIYAAVINSVTVKVFFALVAVLDLHCHQFDFVTAFLNAPIPDGAEYFVEPPVGLGNPPGYACLLHKALYGLRKSPLYWFLAIKPVMESLGFEALSSDLCLFRDRKRGVLVALYVDDLLVAAQSVKSIFEVRNKLNAIYDLKELGEVRRFLGFDVVRDRDARKIFITQSSYIKALLKKVDMWDCSPVSSPWPNKFELPTNWEPLMGAQKGYIKKTGSINWVACGTRPDISYTASRLCEANAGPSQEHLDLLKHLFRYLRGTVDHGLDFGGHLDTSDLKLTTFADASWADCQPTRHSTGAYVVFLAGGPVYWKTKKQTFVALSTTEAEFTNLTPAGRSALWVAKILEDCGVPQPAPQILFTDSLNAYITVMNPLNVARTRCIDIRYKWIIEQVQQGRLKVEHINGIEMAADGLTKPLLREKHSRFVGILGMTARPIPWAN